MTALRISQDLQLPAEAITQTFGILAKRGVGKTYTASVMTEEMLKADLPVVVCDPIGVWWGLRSSATGKRAGLPIIVLGGDHGDAPLEDTAGAVIADLVVDERVSLVLDLSLFRKAGQVRFMTDFAEQLYRRNREPLHLMLDEADAFAPQRPQKGTERLLGAIEDLVRRGRARGLGMTLITQRPAVLNKNVLTQIEVLVTLRMVAPQDRSAIDDWVKIHGTPEQRDELMQSLPSLPIGTAWFWSPGWLDLFKRVRIRERETFDSSATPEVGARAVEPRKMADVDLAALQERMSATIERAKADDPKLLRRRITDLERQLAAPREPEIVREVVEIEVVPAAHRDALRAAHKIIDRLAHDALDVRGRLDFALKDLDQQQVTASATTAAHQRPRVPTSDKPRPAAPTAATTARSVVGVEGLNAPRTRILDTIAWFAAIGVDAPRRAAVAPLAGTTATSSGFERNLSGLRTDGLIDYPAAGRLALTPEGASHARRPDGTPTTEALQQAVLSHLNAPRAAIVRALIAAYPESISRDELADRVGVSAASSGFERNLSGLRTLELIDYPAAGYVIALPILFLEGDRP